MALAANAGSNITCWEGETVKLDGSASTDYLDISQADGTWSIRWETGDGYDVLNIIGVGHTYVDPGVYTARLTVKDAGGNADTDEITVTVNAIPAAEGGNVQTLTNTGNTSTNTSNLVSALSTAASNSATNEVVVPAGFTVNEFQFPARSAGHGTYVTLRVADADTNLPKKHRVVSGDTSDMFQVNVRGPATGGVWEGVRFASGAHYYRIIGMNAVASGADDDAPALMTIEHNANNTHIIIDRSILNGNNLNRRVGVSSQGRSITIMNSSILDIKSTTNDSYAVGSWDGLGPLGIINNRLTGSSMVILFGGAGSYSDTQWPSDICIRGNYCWKDPSWNAATYRVKCTFESKLSRRVVIAGNIWENSVQTTDITEANHSAVWISAAGPGEETQQMDFRNNKFLNQNAYMLYNGGPNSPASRSTRVFFRNNLFEANSRNDTGYARNVYNGIEKLELIHNTYADRRSSGTMMSFFVTDSTADGSTSIRMRDNFAMAGEYGIFRGGGASGSAALSAAVGSYEFVGNVLYDTNDQIGASDYPSGNFYPNGNQAAFMANFVNAAEGNYELDATSDYKGDATDGSDPGVNWAELEAATENALAGIWVTNQDEPEPPPVPAGSPLMIGGAMLLGPGGRPLVR